MITPFILHWLDSRATSNEWGIEFPLALDYLSVHGAEIDHALANDQLQSLHGCRSNVIVGRMQSHIKWGSSIALADCWSVELAVAKLHFMSQSMAIRFASVKSYKGC